MSNIRDGFRSFTPDGKAIVGDRYPRKGAMLLQYQPIDGSPTHLMTDPTHETQTAVAWSPSGSKMGVLQLRKSSDVVLITDLGNKQSR